LCVSGSLGDVVNCWCLCCKHINFCIYTRCTLIMGHANMHLNIWIWGMLLTDVLTIYCSILNYRLFKFNFFLTHLNYHLIKTNKIRIQEYFFSTTSTSNSKIVLLPRKTYRCHEFYNNLLYCVHINLSWRVEVRCWIIWQMILQLLNLKTHRLICVQITHFTIAFQKINSLINSSLFPVPFIFFSCGLAFFAEHWRETPFQLNQVCFLYLILCS